MANIFLLLAGLAGFIGVGAGASARHIGGIDTIAHERFEIASHYLLFHAVALLALSSRLEISAGRARFSRNALVIAGVLFTGGMLLFGGGLILLASTGISGFVWSVPVGGTCFLVGWLAVFLAGLATYASGRR